MCVGATCFKHKNVINSIKVVWGWDGKKIINMSDLVLVKEISGNSCMMWRQREERYE